MTVTDEMLSAFLDGELSADEANAIESAIKSDAALAARLERMKKVAPLIAKTYAAIDNKPLPEAVRALLHVDESEQGIEKESSVVKFLGKKSLHLQGGWITSMAASVALLIGVGVGLQLAPRNDWAAGNAIASVIEPSNPFYAALESTQSAQHVDTSSGLVTPVLTFKSRSGQYCREFLVAGEAVTNRAVACRSGDR